MRSLSSKIMVSVAAGFLITIILVAFSLSGALRKNTRENSVFQAKELINQYKLLRGYYTKNVVAKVKENSKLDISYDHEEKAATIPLPATMIHDLSSELKKNNIGTQLKLYSKFPFPNRKGRVLDAFSQDAMAYLQKDPDGTFVAEEEIGNSEYVRVAIADRLVARACVECHNSHPDSPKTDWKLGDVRGVLEISTPIDSQLEQSANTLMSKILLIAIIGASVGGFLFYIISRVIGPLKEIIQKLSAGSDQLWEASQEISSFSQSLSEAATEQASSIEETSSAMEQMASIAGQNAEHADSANSKVLESNEVLDAGGRNVSDMSQSMAEINVAFQKINKIVRSIDEIAFETNLLSLNASLEASEAGESGKRFSVVADEVRALSDKASESARETVELIKGANERIESGNKIANSLRNSFDDVEKSAKDIAGLVGQIHAASNEQARGCEQVNHALLQMDQGTQGNSASAQQASASAQQLAAQANQMRSIVAKLSLILMGRAVDSQYQWNGKRRKKMYEQKR